MAASPPNSSEPKQVIKLFNGKNLDNFYTYLGPPGKGQKPLGKNNDPEKVFTVKDGMIGAVPIIASRPCPCAMPAGLK